MSRLTPRWNMWPGIQEVIHAAGITAVYVTAHSTVLVPDHTFAEVADRDQFIRAFKERATER